MTIPECSGISSCEDEGRTLSRERREEKGCLPACLPVSWVPPTTAAKDVCSPDAGGNAAQMKSPPSASASVPSPSPSQKHHFSLSLFSPLTYSPAPSLNPSPHPPKLTHFSPSSVILQPFVASDSDSDSNRWSDS